MKNTYVIISIMFLLSSCSTESIPNEESLLDVPATSLVGESVSDSILDNKLLYDAISQTNLNTCEMIQKSTVKKECITIIESLNIFENAKRNLDKTICDEIKLERYKNACQQEVLSLIEFKNKEKKEQEYLEQESEIIKNVQSEAYNKEDISLCDALEDVNQQNVCYYNVTTIKAINSKNILLCNDLENEIYQVACKDSFFISEN